MAEAYNSIHTGPVIDQGVSYANSMATYSTEEAVVGRWINGKPIYRQYKNLTINMPPKSNTPLFNLMDCDTFIGCCGTVRRPNGNLLSVPGYYAEVFKAGDSGQLSGWYGGNGTSAELVVYSLSLKYTKTTDAATIAVPTVDELNAAYAEGVQSA